MPRSTVATRSPLLTRGLRLEYATLGWNVVGVIVVAVAALRAQSVALAGFGLDSLIEIFASVVVVWDLTGAPHEREERALRLIGAAFFALAVYLLAQTAVVLLAHARPAPSPLGIVWLAITAAAMFLLAWGKRRTGRQLGNPVLAKEAGVTIVDGLLAVAVLIGLILNAGFGWWWADPLAGLVIIAYGLREGWTAWREA
ncbi:MAG TPA: cation transporter [Thermomicrobiales bacterium]|nr:cation transporter [Thermomicrobiales bacterium]